MCVPVLQLVGMNEDQPNENKQSLLIQSLLCEGRLSLGFGRDSKAGRGQGNL